MFTQNENDFDKLIFKFTNIKAVCLITSTTKSSLKEQLFQWSQLQDHPKLMNMINAWWRNL
jgi:hypothetical protein